LVSGPAAGFLIVGFAAPFASFAGGVLVPSPDAAVPIMADLPLSARWPKGIPAGTPLYLQAWFKSLATGEFSATNALVTIPQSPPPAAAPPSPSPRNPRRHAELPRGRRDAARLRRLTPEREEVPMDLATIVLVVAAIGGVSMVSMRLSGRPRPPTWLAI